MRFFSYSCTFLWKHYHQFHPRPSHLDSRVWQLTQHVFDITQAIVCDVERLSNHLIYNVSSDVINNGRFFYIFCMLASDEQIILKQASSTSIFLES